MEITIINETDEELVVDNSKCFYELAENLTEKLKLCKELSCTVVFVEMEKIRELNRDYRNTDQPTDVLSFALRDLPENYDCPLEILNYLGDIIICTQAISDQATKYQHSEKRETAFLFVHGLLHLLGYDHQDEESEQLMCSLQSEVLGEIN